MLAVPFVLRRSIARAAVVAVMVMPAVGCDDRTPPPGPQAGPTTPSTPVGPSVSGLCPGEEQTISDPGLRSGGTLGGDVDGDGAEDSVALATDPSGDDGCRVFVVIEGSAGTGSAPLDGGLAFDLGLPRLRSLVDIDGRPGAEVVALATAGASTEFLAAFTWRDGGLERVRLDDPELPAPDLFPYGGSVSHLDAPDCADDDQVVLASAVARGDGYRVTRRYYGFDGARLVLQGESAERVSFDGIAGEPEFTGAPFSSC